MNAMLMAWWNDCWFVGLREGIEKWLTLSGLAPTTIPRAPFNNIFILPHGLELH
jgi:hypothetical protein